MPGDDRAPSPEIDLERLRALVPALGSSGLAQAAASDRPLRGRVLRLRLGFNPNSSSVGTTVVVLLWGLASSGAVLALAAAVLAWRFGATAPAPPAPEPRT